MSRRVIEEQAAFRNQSFKQFRFSAPLDMVIPASEEAKEFLQGDE